MSQSNETPQEVLLKVKKIKALAERGIGGEKEAARKLLAALCAKYGISEEEISEEKKYTYSFHVRTSVFQLFLQVYSSMFGGTERYENELHIYKSKNGNDIICDFTPVEYIEFSQLWEWHRKNYLEERKKMRKLFENGYIRKHNLFPTELDPKFKKKDNEMTFEELAAIEALASACENKTFHKQIGDKETPYGEENEWDDD